MGRDSFMSGQGRPVQSSLTRDDQREVTLLIGLGIISIVLWGSPWGGYLLYPFSILATWFHEMGHGLTAIALGGRFEKLLIFSNGSGLAYHRGHLALGAFGRALVSTGGLMGPPIAGAALLMASRHASQRDKLCSSSV